MNKTILRFTAAAMSVAAAISAQGAQRAAILIDANSVDDLNFQEYAATRFFTEIYPDGLVITPSQIDKINTDEIGCLWIHIDRINAGAGWDRLPATFRNTQTLSAISNFVAKGGGLYLSKHATQLISAIGRVDNRFAPNIYSDGDGGAGMDDWTINAHIGYWFVMDPASDHYDVSQYYNRTVHPIYKDIPAGMYNDFRCETFAMEGTGDPATSLHREDHNCMWDLNGYSYTADGKNTVERFENENNAQVLGTWGHVIDHAVAGIVEFMPTDNVRGRVIANGLATCEWSPRTGTNAYHNNLRALTANTLSYLVSNNTTGVDGIVADTDDSTVSYYNLQGVEVNGDNLTPGLYIRRSGKTATRVLVR